MRMQVRNPCEKSMLRHVRVGSAGVIPRPPRKPVWNNRSVLFSRGSDGLMHRALVQTLERRERNWEVISFCEVVMRAKEKAEQRSSSIERRSSAGRFGSYA
ncbi:unnamed protein product [Spodoptera exigua]|nr:unnamed protein product [Spodoptera exigua]